MEQRERLRSGAAQLESRQAGRPQWVAIEKRYPGRGARTWSSHPTRSNAPCSQPGTGRRCTARTAQRRTGWCSSHRRGPPSPPRRTRGVACRRRTGPCSSTSRANRRRSRPAAPAPAPALAQVGRSTSTRSPGRCHSMCLRFPTRVVSARRHTYIDIPTSARRS